MMSLEEIQDYLQELCEHTPFYSEFKEDTDSLFNLIEIKTYFIVYDLKKKKFVRYRKRTVLDTHSRKREPLDYLYEDLVEEFVMHSKNHLQLFQSSPLEESPMPIRARMSNGQYMEQKKEDHCAECQTFHWLLVPVEYQGLPFKLCRGCFGRRLGLKSV